MSRIKTSSVFFRVVCIHVQCASGFLMLFTPRKSGKVKAHFLDDGAQRKQFKDKVHLLTTPSEEIKFVVSVYCSLWFYTV